MAQLNDPRRLRLATAEMTALRPERRLQACVERARTLGGAPIAAITLVLQRIQFFRAYSGLPPGLAASRATSRYNSFCALVVQGEEPLIVNDAARDVRVPQELVETLGIASYVGVPVCLGGSALGALCVIDYEPRRFDTSLSRSLALLAEDVAWELTMLEACKTTSRFAPRSNPYTGLRDALRTAERALSRVATIESAAERLIEPDSDEGARRAALEILEAEEAHASLRGAILGMRIDLSHHDLSDQERTAIDEKLFLADLSLTEAEPWLRLSRSVVDGYVSPSRAGQAARVLRESLRFYESIADAIQSVSHSSIAPPSLRAA